MNREVLYHLAQVLIIVVSELLDNNEAVSIIKFCTAESCATGMVQVGITDRSGTLNVGARLMDAAESVGSWVYGGSPTTITVGTWYRLGVYFNIDDEITIEVGGVTEITTADVTDLYDVEAYLIGSEDDYSYLSDSATVIQTDIIGVDNDTMPGACP